MVPAERERDARIIVAANRLRVERDKTKNLSCFRIVPTPARKPVLSQKCLHILVTDQSVIKRGRNDGEHTTDSGCLVRATAHIHSQGGERCLLEARLCRGNRG